MKLVIEIGSVNLLLDTITFFAPKTSRKLFATFKNFNFGGNNSCKFAKHN
jgi:hypothetical protein